MSDRTDDARPLPRYGQYASPEEQRERMGVPERQDAQPPVAPTASPGPAETAPLVAGPSRGRLFDRAATVALLVYGLFNVVQSIPILLDATRMLQLMGVDVELSDPAASRAWGVAAVVLLALGWVATALLAWRSLRRGRLSFWVPVVGGIVFNLLASVVVVIPLLGDPAVVEGILQLQDSLGS
ncbi:DUF6264 family protein [Microbacterium betulae]|uniref:DUF6264 family protein n=1 Tax=Microbacterium betulae TaxID=2981139 RepID=A0AA97I7K9_9MICO|nr:DUF6264 family protein [Microbacterium sp. AB]WOF24387.1 DUF6264 family protein [Microbacterium sp. AB]